MGKAVRTSYGVCRNGNFSKGRISKLTFTLIKHCISIGAWVKCRQLSYSNEEKFRSIMV